MDYVEALDYLYSRLPMYQRLGKVAYKADLNNTIALLDALDNPHGNFKSVHIAGTNGKGSSAHAITAILQVAGYKVGLYTSPHLKEFTERIKVNGRELAKEWVTDFVNKSKDLIESVNPSFFEVTVAMAFQYFADEEVDIAVVETGIGGRLDSTNVLSPEVCLITNIGLDHTDLLGDTIQKIAAEKAGIIKPNVPVVIGDMTAEAVAVMREVADQKGSQLIRTIPTNEKHSKIPYFNRNAPGVIAVIEELTHQGWNISKENMNAGLLDFVSITGLKGRYQVLRNSPKVIADVSHNAEGLKLLFDHINTQEFNKLRVIFGTVKEKLHAPIFEVLPKNAIYYFTQSGVPRSLDANVLKGLAAEHEISGEVYENVNVAMKAALSEANSQDLVLITGSTFVVAEVAEL